MPKTPTKPLTLEQQANIDSLPKLNIGALAALAKRDWTTGGKKVYFGAVPYLDAMRSMDKASDNYGLDSGTDIIFRFLANAQTWRGPIAKAVKAELTKRIKM